MKAQDPATGWPVVQWITCQNGSENYSLDPRGPDGPTISQEFALLGPR